MERCTSTYGTELCTQNHAHPPNTLQSIKSRPSFYSLVLKRLHVTLGMKNYQHIEEAIGILRVTDIFTLTRNKNTMSLKMSSLLVFSAFIMLNHHNQSLMLQLNELSLLPPVLFSHSQEYGFASLFHPVLVFSSHHLLSCQLQPVEGKHSPTGRELSLPPKQRSLWV